jgi:hypothetical protein
MQCEGESDCGGCASCRVSSVVQLLGASEDNSDTLPEAAS